MVHISWRMCQWLTPSTLRIPEWFKAKKFLKLHDETLQSKGDQFRGAWCIHLRTCQALSAAEWTSFFCWKRLRKTLVVGEENKYDMINGGVCVTFFFAYTAKQQQVSCPVASGQGSYQCDFWQEKCSTCWGHRNDHATGLVCQWQQKNYTAQADISTPYHHHSPALRSVIILIVILLWLFSD